jgi:hypothetical protein
MTTNGVSFHSISKISKWLVNWTIANIIITVINSIVFYAFAYTSSGMQSSSNIGLIISLVASINLVIVIVISIITLSWYSRATKNIHSFGAKEVTSPKMAVIWWFVPIVHLWMPYDIAQQIWKASNPLLVLSNGTEWKKYSSSNTIKIWWIIGILSIIIAIFGEIFLVNASAQLLFEPSYSVEPVSAYGSFEAMLTTISGIISAIFFIRMIKQVATWQEIKGGKSI